MNKMMTMMSYLIFLSSCSSVKNEMVKNKEHEEFQKEYRVIDASMSIRPGWISEANRWAMENAKKDEDTNEREYSYFSYETMPMMDRDLACSLAKTKVKSTIASGVASFIEEKLSQVREGNTAIDDSLRSRGGLREYLETNLASKTAAMISGVQFINTYWEKRRFEKEKGAKRDYQAFTCAVLVRISKENLDYTLREARQKISRDITDEEVRKKVNDALENVEESFEKYKKGAL